MKLLTKVLTFSVAVLITFDTDFSNDYEKLLAQLEKQTYDYVQEKVYLHLDKPYYSLGDDLWFKAYTVAGPNHTPTPLSENLHVELIGPDAELIERHTIFLSKGLGKGDFKLADSLKAGTYTLRAYTNWMRNFDEAFFYTRQIRIVELDQVATDLVRPQPKLALRFFPEGGELIARVPGQVAFEGNRPELAGVIIDDSGQGVASFESTHEGRGQFGLTPMPERSYYAKVNGDPEKYELPVVKPTGMSLAVDNLRDDDFTWVNVKTASTEPEHEAFLIAHVRGLVAFSSKLEWKGALARVKIPKASVPEGVVHLTLFDKSWSPVAERLIYQQRQQGLINFQVESDQSTYGPRDSTTVTLKLTDMEGKGMKGFFSLSAFDSQQITPESLTESIQSSLLLTSDIEATKQPVQYFNNLVSVSAENLDLLMLTRGWRRFTWSDLQEDRFPEIEQEVERGFSVSGMVTKGQKPVSKGTVKQVGLFEGIPAFVEAETDGKGRFEMKNLHYYESDGLVRASDRKGKSNVTLQLDEQEELPLDAYMISPKEITDLDLIAAYQQKSKERKEIDQAYDLDTGKVTDLGTVVVEASSGSQDFVNRQRGLFFNRGEYGFNASDAMANGQQYRNALYLMQGKIPGLNIVLGTNGEPVVQLNRKVFSFINPDPPIQYYIDDGLASLEAVTALPAQAVERVEVLKGMRATGVFGPAANGGAIMIYTKNSEEYEQFYERLAENGVITDKSTLGLPGGYYRSREFYTPNYFGEQRNQPKPDFRALIHWEPMIETDEQGEAVIKFFNADIPTTIQVHVEGIWEGGIPLVGTASYQVKK